MNKVAAVVILFLMAGALSSCSLHRLAAGKVKQYDWRKGADTNHTGNVHQFIYPQPDTAGAGADSLVLVKKLIEQLTPIFKTRLEYKTFSGKAKVHYDGPEDNQEFTAHFRIRKDSLIWIAITGLGGMVQVARIYITPDSFTMVNLLQKEVTRVPLSSAAKVLPTKVDFASLQRMIVGDPLRDGTITNAANHADSWTMQVEDSSYIQQLTYNKADSAIRAGYLSTRDPRGPQATLEYSGYEMINDRKVATNRVINLKNGNDVFILDMNFQRTDFDMQLDYPVTVPKSYTVKEMKN